jgi:hypothetical protein
MESRLRTWAATGQYTEEEGSALDRPARSARRTGIPAHGALVGVLIPVGVIVGVLFAGAVVLRLLSLPFASLRGTRQHSNE